jgi:hypothetical protein
MKRSQAEKRRNLVDKSKDQTQPMAFPTNYKAAYDAYTYTKYERLFRSNQRVTAVQMVRQYSMLVLWLMVLSVLFVAQRSMWSVHAADPLNVQNQVRISSTTPGL